MAKHAIPMDPKTLDVHIWRERGRVATNLPGRRIIRHSPTGYECGYGGSGPADLALNILLFFERQMVDDPELPLEDARITNAHYQAFKWDWIAPMDREGGICRGVDVLRWIWNRTGRTGIDPAELHVALQEEWEREAVADDLEAQLDAQEFEREAAAS